MKKILIALVVLGIMLTGCAKEEVEKVDISELNSYRVDMSSYSGMNSVDHSFKGITPEEFLNAQKDGASGIFYLGYTGCHICQNAVSLMNEAAIQSGVYIYYIDCYNELYPLLDYEEDFIETIKPMLRKDENGKYGIYTPHVFAMVNGEYVDYEIGLGDYDGSEKAREKAINRYKEIMSYFIEDQ